MHLIKREDTIIQIYIGMIVVFCCLITLPKQASAQYIFHIDDSGVGNSKSIHKTNVESRETEILKSSAPNFTSAHHISSQDSVFLWTGSEVLKTGIDFKNYRLVTTVEGSWSNLLTDFDTENQVMYYNFASRNSRAILGQNLVSGAIDTVITLDKGDVKEVRHYNDGLIYTLSLGFGESVLVNTDFNGQADTLHTISKGSYEKVAVDGRNDFVYFVHEESFSKTNLYRMNLDGSDVTLVLEMQDNVSDVMIDETNQKLFIRYSNKRVKVIDMMVTNPEEQLLFDPEYRIDRAFFNANNNTIGFYSSGGQILEYDIETDTFNSKAIYRPNNNVILLDGVNERIYYFAYFNTESAIYSMNFDGEDIQVITKFSDNYTAADVRDAKLDTVSNYVYYITKRAVKRVLLEQNALEETLISYPYSSGTELQAIELDIEREQIYLYKEDDGIYSLSFDGETETVVTTEGRFENNGLAYNPVEDKIYYTSNKHYMVNPDGSHREEWPKFASREVDKIAFNANRNQLLMTQQGVSFDDDMNSIYQEKINYLTFDENYTSGTYVTMPNPSSTFYNAIEAFVAYFPASSDTVDTSTEENISTLPKQINLDQNYPNPFNPITNISYQLPASSEVSLTVFDMLGRKVAVLINGERKSAGQHQVTFDATNLSSGMYIYRLKAGNKVFSKKLTLIK